MGRCDLCDREAELTEIVDGRLLCHVCLDQEVDNEMAAREQADLDEAMKDRHSR